jgi:hypothetical protein
MIEVDCEVLGPTLICSLARGIRIGTSVLGSLSELYHAIRLMFAFEAMPWM